MSASGAGTGPRRGTRRFAELRASELGELCGPETVLLQPIAAVEQHGPHLPLSTDLEVVTALVDAVVLERGAELGCLVLPPISYGKSNEHTWSAGTVSLEAATLLAVLADLGRSLACTAARKLAFVNGHGGNSALVQVACRDIRVATGLETFLLHPSLPADQGGAGHAAELGMGVHAGLGETSLLLHLRPELVDMDAARRNVPEELAANRWVRFGGPVSFGWTSADFGPTGVIGDPTGATAELGKELFEQMVARLGEQIAEVRTFAFPPR